MYPEAGGSSSFARHAFNEFWSFFAAWGQMLNYMITIAISAFFVPHYLGGLFWDAAAPLARRHHLRHRRRRRAVRGQRRRRQGVGRRQHRCSRSPTSAPSCCWWSSARSSSSRPRRWSTTSTSGVAPTWKDFLIAIPVGDDRLHRHRDDLEHGRGGQGRGEDDPAAINRVVIAVFAIYALLPAVALSRAAGHAERRRQLPDAARPARGAGRLRRRPDPRRRQAPRPRRPPARRRRSTSACSPRRSCSSPPTPASSACRGSSTRWACTARCPTGCASCTRSTARRGSGSSCSARSPA